MNRHYDWAGSCRECGFNRETDDDGFCRECREADWAWRRHSSPDPEEVEIAVVDLSEDVYDVARWR